MDTFVFQLKPTHCLLVIVLFLSCSSKNREGDSQKNSQQPPMSVEVFGRVMHSVEEEHFFSSNQTKDQFRIELTGEDTLNGRVKFQILTHSGESIYSTEFESRALLDFGLPQSSTDADKSRYIIKRMNEFFNEGNFVNPAIGDKEVYDEAYYGVIDEITWNELRKDGKLVGFYYLLWEGDQSWIAFYSRSKKVIKYKTCC